MEEKHPKKENSEIDIKQVMLWKIDNGWIDNEEDSIRSELRRLCPYRKKQSIDRVSHSIMTESGAQLKYQFYTDSKAQQWLDNNSTQEYVIGGFDVELYVQDTNEPVISLGEYSILRDSWIKLPRKRKAHISQVATKNKYRNVHNFRYLKRVSTVTVKTLSP